MPQITLIGLGRIGASIGLALKRNPAAKLLVVGHDRDISIAKQAQARGAVDRADWNLPNACENADAILMCVPLSELRTALQEMASFAKAGCVICDTAPVKAPVLQWADELIPAERYFVGGTPILNPAFLHDGLTGLDAARPDLFDGGLWALVPHGDAPEGALKLISDLTRLVGAKPFFIGAEEHDALMAGTSTLPALAAAALIRAVSNSAGWADARKLADRAFATATASASFVSPTALRAAAVLNPSSTLHYLDALIDQLNALRKAIADRDETALDAMLKEAALARELWLKKRGESDWEAEEPPKTEMPTVRQMMGQMIGLGGRKKKN